MNVVILGANGRMGRALLTAVNESNELNLHAACVRSSSEWVGKPLTALAQVSSVQSHITTLEQTTLDSSTLVIDFTLPDSLEQHLQQCAAAGAPMVIGTTGLNNTQKALLEQYSKRIPIVFAANYSVGVAIMTRLCQIAASRLGDTADIEIIEAHHRYKRDAPSGTAMAIGEAIAEQTGRDLSTDAIFCREGDMGEREQQTIGFSTIRGGDIIGEHTALFADIGERLEITHKASSRQTFARGALRCARWLQNKPAGLYGMEQVLNMEDILSL